MDIFNLEYVEATDEHSDYYRFRKNPTHFCEGCECEGFVGERLPEAQAEENIRNFYSTFGKGEFPFLTITIIRLGNKDHYFYTIHR